MNLLWHCIESLVVQLGWCASKDWRVCVVSGGLIADIEHEPGDRSNGEPCAPATLSQIPRRCRHRGSPQMLASIKFPSFGNLMAIASANDTKADRVMVVVAHQQPKKE